MGGGRMATGGWIGQYGSFGDKLTALGKSNAVMLAGGMLGLDGMNRGGWLGAAIGAAAGLVAGLIQSAVRILFESPEQEAHLGE